MSAQELELTVLKNSSALKAYYRFSAGALTTDSSGNSHTLTNNNTVTEGTGVFGGSADLELSSSQYFSIASHADFNPGTGDFAVGGWFKRESTGWYGGLFAKMSGDDADGYCLVFNNDNTIVFYTNGPSSVTISSSANTSTAWQHIVITRSSGVFRMYLNASSVGTPVSSSIDLDSTNPVHFGTYRSIAGNYFDGMLDDWFFIKGLGLSADQIKELYEGRFIGEAWAQSGLVAGYHLSSITDFSGNNYHLTNNGTTTFPAGLLGGCADLGTSNSSKSLTVTSALGVTTGAMSMSGWFKIRTEIGSGVYELFHHSYSTGGGADDLDNRLFYDYNSGTRRLTFKRYTNAGADANYTITLGTTNWYHIVYVFTGSAVNGYVNGNLVATVAATSTTYNDSTGNGFRIGVYEGGFNYASAMVDEALVFNRALTANEIRKMYAVGTGKYY